MLPTPTGPLGQLHENPDHVTQLEQWMKSYRPEELFDEDGRLKHEFAELAPAGEHRMGDNLHANGGMLLKSLRLPDYCDYAVEVPSPGSVTAEATRVQGKFLRDVMKLNLASQDFRIFSPDEIASNRWGDVFDVTDRAFVGEILPTDDHLFPDGRVSVTDHCLRSHNKVNVIVAGKQPTPQWLTMDQAIKHCSAGIGIWD